MKCEKCGGISRVDLCRKKDNGSIYRRRKCMECGNRWTTIELPVEYMKGIISDLARIAQDMRKR